MSMDVPKYQIPVDVILEDNVILEMIDIRRRYGSLEVLKGLNLAVKQGEVYGFLGRNGAGKSTAIRIMMGITKANHGQLRIFGQTVESNPVKLRQRIGYVAQEQNFYGWMSPTRLGKFVSGFYPGWNPERYKQLLKNFELPPGRRLGTFSGGMKAKLGLSVALATSPELLILDEPTAGMDPVGRREFLSLVRAEAMQTGATIFFSTHLIDDIESVADRINIIDAGKTLYEGALKPLTRNIRSFSVALDESGANEYPLNFCTHQNTGQTADISPRLLQSIDHGGRRNIILQFPPGVPLVLSLNPGWRAEEMTLEDVFVALVSRAG